MCAMLANPLPPERASAEEAERLLARVEMLAGRLDGAEGLAAVIDDAETLAADLGDVASAAVVGVPSAAATLMQGVLALARALRAEDEPAVLLALETLRAGLLDLAESQPVRRDLPPGALLSWLDDHLGGDRIELAAILGTSRRSLQRWLQQPFAMPPAAIPRLRLVARLVNDLRFAYDGGAPVARWFVTPKRALNGATPVDVLGDPEAAALLAPLAAGTRFA